MAGSFELLGCSSAGETKRLLAAAVASHASRIGLANMLHAASCQDVVVHIGRLRFVPAACSLTLSDANMGRMHDTVTRLRQLEG